MRRLCRFCLSMVRILVQMCGRRWLHRDYLRVRPWCGAEVALSIAVIMDCDRCVDLAFAKITDRDIYSSVNERPDAILTDKT